MGHGDDGEGDVRQRIRDDEGLADALVQFFVRPAQARPGGDHGAHRRAADEVDRHAGLAQGLQRADMGVGPGAAARQNHADRGAGDDAGDPRRVVEQTLDRMEPAARLEGVQPGSGLGGARHVRGAQQDQVGQRVGFVLDLLRGEGRVRRPVGLAHHEDAIHLTRAQRGPAGFVGFSDVEDVVVGVLDAREPLGGG
ncbi:hypothetical protein D3C72_1691320 [compost metagenome]